jgi:UDP-N-acetylmuramate dehydrogenase
MNIIEQDLTKFSTIRTKSYAKYFCIVKSVDDIKEAIEFKSTHNLKHVVLGNGSNILFSKDQYDDIVFIKLSGEFDFFKINKDSINIGASYSLKLAGKELVKNGYSDYIFFNLIPACIGGAVTQNAGTKSDGEIKDVCTSVRLFDILEHKIIELTNNECLFKYRDSIIKKVPNRYIVLSAQFNNSNKTNMVETLKLKAKEKISDKVDREPFGYSFGSTFMNARLPAWECVKHVKDYLEPIEGAFYSEKHSNWIVNNNNSSGENIINLIRETQSLVQEELDIKLINEVRII